MKAITINHPKFGVCHVQFSPHVSHDDFLEALGKPACLDAGFVTLPDAVQPRYVGHSTSLSLAPSSMGRKVMESGYEITKSQYPFAPLFEVTK